MLDLKDQPPLEGEAIMPQSVLRIPCITLRGERKTLADYAGRVLLVVNTASQCGLTPQYRELEQLWQTYRERGLVVFGFPCNQFGKQEPGDENDIAAFCELNYGVSFPLFSKVEVNGRDAHPLFIELKHRAPGMLGFERINWNFTKFLISGDGRQVKRFSPLTKPQSLVSDIEALLR